MSGLTANSFTSHTIKLASGRSVPVVIGDGTAGRLDKHLNFGGYTSVVLISDTIVSGLYAHFVIETLSECGVRILEYILPAGERSKSLRTAERAFKFLLENNIDRKAVICILGGGVPGDVGGYIASAYLRGIAYIQIPTTLLAQVDSSIGGKVGINFLGKKNMLGSFYQPRAVIIDVGFLKSLPSAEMRNGLAEVIKYGVALDAELFNIIEQKGRAKFNSGELINIVGRCVRLKSGIVVKDETERTGERAVLNFGHTAGHAVEAAGRFKTYRHGEAVAIGMVAAARISRHLGMLDGNVVSRIENLLNVRGLPVSCPGMSADDLFEAVRFDKKTAGGRTAWVLLNGIGSPVTDQVVPDKVVKNVFKGICS